jgi:endonuclease I
MLVNRVVASSGGGGRRCWQRVEGHRRQCWATGGIDANNDDDDEMKEGWSALLTGLQGAAVNQMRENSRIGALNAISSTISPCDLHASFHFM